MGYNTNMTDSIKDLLLAKDYDEPPEIKTVKGFLRTHYSSDCHVTVQSQQIIIAVKGAALAGALRLRLHELQTLCHTDKRLVLRIIS